MSQTTILCFITGVLLGVLINKLGEYKRKGK